MKIDPAYFVAYDKCHAPNVINKILSLQKNNS